MAKYLELKAGSLEKLNYNFASETTRKIENSWQRIVCIQVSSNPSAVCKFGALFHDNYYKLERA